MRLGRSLASPRRTLASPRWTLAFHRWSLASPLRSLAFLRRTLASLRRSSVPPRRSLDSPNSRRRRGDRRIEGAPQSGPGSAFPSCQAGWGRWHSSCSSPAAKGAKVRKLWMRIRVGQNPGFFKKTQPSGFFWVFLGFFWVFWVFLGFWGFFAQKRGFLGFFPVSRILLGASRL